jgi:SAM-dependent methyltransferase
MIQVSIEQPPRSTRHGGDAAGGDTGGFEQRYYENPLLWDPSTLDDADHERIREVLARIPADATSLVDVGCGNGICCNQARAARPALDRVVGCDRSRAALARVTVEKQVAEVDDLPFRDREFDVAASLEVLEHLPIETYAEARRELARVTSRTLIVTVPWNERLTAAAVHCPTCGTRFHRYLHVRSFDRAAMTTMFDEHGFRCREATALFGPPRPFVPEPLKAWARRILGRHRRFGSALCPVCGHHERPAAGGAGRSSAPKLWPTARRPKWWLAVYERG